MDSEYFLMHKDIPVCLMAIDDNGSISRIRRNPAQAVHFPIGGQMNDMKFHEWWNDRAIPRTRHGAKTALQKLGYTSTGNALVNNLALSLSDCYWICPQDAGITWREINLFTNDFVDAFGDITLNRDHVVDLRNRTRFNCASSQGELQKKWCIDSDGRRYMIKGNYGESYQQSINELFATQLHRQQQFANFTEYFPAKLTVDGGREGLGCMCYDYCSENVELISAWELLQSIKIRRNESLYYPLREVCTGIGMSEDYFRAFMDYQIMTDYLLTNTDRHMNNIAIVRDPDSLRILGFAPIFDSGNSMFYNIPYDDLGTVQLRQVRTHSFIEKEIRLLQYVANRKAVDLNRAEMDFGVYEMDITERKIRIPRLKELYQRKLDSLSAFQQGKDIWKEDRYSSGHSHFA